MEFWVQIRLNNHRDLMLYWSQTCFGVWDMTLFFSNQQKLMLDQVFLWESKDKPKELQY